MPRSGYTICTSEQRPTSTAVSHGFVVEQYSSPPFGSHGPCKHSKPCPLDCGSGVPMQGHPSGIDFAFTTHWGLIGGTLCCTVPLCKLHRLLGPCYKTGRGWRCHCVAKLSCPSHRTPQRGVGDQRATTIENGAVTVRPPNPDRWGTRRPGYRPKTAPGF